MRPFGTRTAAICLMNIVLVATLLPGTITGLDISFMKNTSPVNDSSDQSDLDMVVVGSGNESVVLISYVDLSYGTNSPHVAVKRSRDGGSTWDPVIDLQDNISSGNRQIQPSIDAYSDQNGTMVCVAYMDSQYRQIPTLQEFVIICAVSIDNGSTWTRSLVTPLELPAYPSNKIRFPRLKFGLDGSIFVVWEDLEDDDRIHISFSLDGGGNWSRPQKVAEQADPDNPASSQRRPDVASDGKKIYVAWEEDPDWKVCSFLSKADHPSSSGEKLEFDTPWKIANPLVYPMYTIFDPVIEADGEGVHLAWWDFSTDQNGNNNGDFTLDRPCIKYTTSSDHGGNWSVNGSANIKVNGSLPSVWHSSPDLAIGKGIVAVSWIDRTVNGSRVLASYSLDNGSSWSTTLKANEYRDSSIAQEQKISIDENGTIHCTWFESVNGGEKDIYHSRTRENLPPVRPADANSFPTSAHGAIITWSANIEPDFDHYEVFLGRDVLSYNLTEWPDGELYARIFDQGKESIEIADGLEADTSYVWAVRTVDSGERISESLEGTFRTHAVNEPPTFTGPLPDILMEEDMGLPRAINLSELIELGIVVDDAYEGHDELDLDIETNSSNRNISGQVDMENGHRYVHMHQTCKNWHGSEAFRLVVRDTGKDGCFHTPDDLTASSNWFDVSVSPVNDPPVFLSFTDLWTGWRSEISPGQTLLEVPREVSGCFETLDYSFSVSGRDVDGDFLTFTIDDPRFDITVDELDPKHTSIVSFKPLNDDVPWLGMRLRITDGKAVSGELYLRIWVHDHDSPPFFRFVDGRKVNMTGDVVRFEVDEGSELTFSVVGDDIDPGEVLVLGSSIGSGASRIVRTGPDTWNVTVNEGWHAENGTFTFELYLIDRAKVNMAVLKVVLEPSKAVPSLLLAEEWLEVSYIFDLSDRELGINSVIGPEWNETVSFKANAVISGSLRPTWRWVINDEENRELKSVYGNPISVEFIPSEGELGYIDEGVFNILLTVSVGDVEPVRKGFRIIITSDGDDDNDGLPDDREIIHFGDLTQGPEEDPDGDGYSNSIEMMNPLGSPTDPMDPLSYPGSSNDDDDDHDDDANDPRVNPGIDLSGIHPVLILSVLSVISFVILVLTGLLVMIRRERAREAAEEEEIEEKVKNMQRRQDEIEGLYGIQQAGGSFGPDQSTLDDLGLDLGGSIYHGDGDLTVRRTGGRSGGEISGGSLPEREGEGPPFRDGL
ncbi:MAG: hypothetical protein ACMUHY_08275 [Thermoplasmatota archaeon]